jgi:signal transduction histidine kinase
VYTQSQTVEMGSTNVPQIEPFGVHGSHSVQFYEDDSAFIDNLIEFVGSALGAGGACILIATEAHRQELADRLQARGIDIHHAARMNRYISLDAEQTLARFMVANRPDRDLFSSAIEPELQRAQLGNLRKSGALVAFGEMVAVLWAKGKFEAAIQLEKLWNELVHRHSFILRCAYPMACFANESQHELFRQVCTEHSQVVPAESYMSLDDENDRLRMVSSLQQKAAVTRIAVQERERESAQRQQVEAKLRRTELFANHVLESSIDCVKVLDLNGRLDYMNSPGLRALEIEDANQVLGKYWVDFWKEEDKARAEAAVAAAKAGDLGSFEGDCLTVGGTRKSWDVKITPVLGADGSVERLVAVSRDITAIKNAQLVAIQAEKLAAAGRMAATIAHEINNPLEAVTNLIFLAMTTPGVPDGVCRQLEIADRELARVAQIAQQTLGFYKDTSKNRSVNLGELVEDVLIVYERKMRCKRLDTAISIDRNLNAYCKQGELRQVLSNLIANAIDASKPGGTIWLRAQATMNWTNGMERGVRITLADNGVGMTQEVKQRIFVPFFTTKANVGTGIGLWITKCLIEQQGGHLRFRSRQGSRSGTVMSFFIPCQNGGRIDEANQTE